MTDARDTIVYRRTEEPGTIYGVPDTDLTQADIDRLPAILHREIRHSTLFESTDLTRAENEQRKAEEEAARLAAEQQEAADLAAKDAAAAANQSGDGAGDKGGE